MGLKVIIKSQKRKEKTLPKHLLKVQTVIHKNNYDRDKPERRSKMKIRYYQLLEKS
jgi:hypothetical protein